MTGTHGSDFTFYIAPTCGRVEFVHLSVQNDLLPSALRVCGFVLFLIYIIKNVTVGSMCVRFVSGLVSTFGGLRFSLR